MSENQDVTDETIQELLRRPELKSGAAHQFAAAHVFAFEDSCRNVLHWQRTEGRAAVVAGEDPDVVREQALARIDEARRTLHGKLTTLLAWAGERADQPQGPLDSGGPDAD